MIWKDGQMGEMREYGVGWESVRRKWSGRYQGKELRHGRDKKDSVRSGEFSKTLLWQKDSGSEIERIF